MSFYHLCYKEVCVQYWSKLELFKRVSMESIQNIKVKSCMATLYKIGFCHDRRSRLWNMFLDKRSRHCPRDTIFVMIEEAVCGICFWIKEVGIALVLPYIEATLGL